VCRNLNEKSNIQDRVRLTMFLNKGKVPVYIGTKQKDRSCPYVFLCIFIKSILCSAAVKPLTHLMSCQLKNADVMITLY